MAIAAPDHVLTHVDRDGCLDSDRGLSAEWLETDGLGGYASSTVWMCPTRRYHGLLVERPPGRARRHVLLSRFEETLLGAGRSFPLSVARYPDTFAPAGHRWLSSFELAPFPTWRYRIGPAEVVREVLLVRGEPIVLCRYRVRGHEEGFALELRPFLPYREADALTSRNDELDTSVEALAQGLRCRPYADLPPLSITLAGTAHAFRHEPVWYRDLEFREDARRGYPAREDQFTPGVLHLELDGETEVVVAATAGDPVRDPLALWRDEARRRIDALGQLSPAATRADLRCAAAADDFLHHTSKGRLAVDAGYPWFGEWGRDAFVALPGLTLARCRSGPCAEALSGALEFLEDGLLPNVYGLSKEDSHYGSVDAALWFARAVRLYENAGGDEQRVREEYGPALVEIAEAYAEGTKLGIAADDGGLISAGSPELNPTWMDARTPAGPVTPRDGCAVEICALWYSLLQHLERLATARGNVQAKRRWSELRRRAKRSFLERFWIEDERRLADRWKDGVQDARVRPNMVIAAALEFSPLTRAQRAGVVACSEAELLTPRGLRTLSPRDPAYRRTYSGGPEQRDGAYHQGTVWPWLLGFHCEAHLRAHGTSRRVRDRLTRLWDAFEPELDRCGLNHLSEVFDGDPPHRPGGTIAQAWNTAEYLRSRAMLSKSRA